MRRLALPLAALLALLQSACVTHLGKPEAASAGPAITTGDYQRLPDLVYTPAGWPEALKADLYLPAAAGLKPAVLLIHGGGWAAPDRRYQMAGIAQRLAARGYVVMNASYRFAPQYRYPAQIDDLHQALKWLRGNATLYSVDPARVASFGYSAGAHLAALLGAMNGPPAERVQAVVAGGTPADLRDFSEGRLVPDLLGGRLDEIPAIYAAASPILHISAGDPPVFLYHGSWDAVVSVDQATRYQAALSAGGVYNELYLLQGLGHVAAFVFDGGAVDAAMHFLDRQLLPLLSQPAPAG